MNDHKALRLINGLAVTAMAAMGIAYFSTAQEVPADRRQSIKCIDIYHPWTKEKQYTVNCKVNKQGRCELTEATVEGMKQFGFERGATYECKDGES